MFNYQQIDALSFLVFFLLVVLSLTPFARGRLLLQVIGLLLGGGCRQPVSIDCSMSTTIYAQILVGCFVVLPCLLSFLLLFL